MEGVEEQADKDEDFARAWASLRGRFKNILLKSFNF